MPTIITHGIIALALAAKARSIRALDRRKLFLACVICAMLPDIDYVGFKLDVQYNSLFGHRGFTHSFAFAGILALITSWLFHRRSRESALGFAKLFLLFFAVTASHPILDAMTDGGEGVAFFSPFSNHRYFFPYRPILVSPLGISAFFGSLRGLLVLIDELLLIILPIGAALFWREILERAKTRKPLAIALLAAWALGVLALNGLSPRGSVLMAVSHPENPVVDLYAKQYNNAQILYLIPTEGLRDRRLVTNFLEFQRLGLFNRRLEGEKASERWASGFFPSWFGGIAGRWQDSNATLLLRSIFGYGVPHAEEIRALLKEAGSNSAKGEFLFRLSPTEKYDLSVGDYGFSSTRSILAITHNAEGWPKYWSGVCNGMAAASRGFEEPYRAVDVINPNGFRIRFHPNDIKALLGYSMANVAEWTRIGSLCNTNGPEAAACRVNPAVFFVAAMNRIGLAHDGFIVDGFSGTRKQFYLFDAFRLEVLQDPKPVEELPNWVVPTPVKSLVKVRFTMEFVSTLLSDKAGGQEETAPGSGVFRKVGRVVVPKVLEAMLALDQNSYIIGGAWLGEEDVSDVLYFPRPTPAIDALGRLTVNTAFYWRVIELLHRKSVSTERNPAPLDFSL